MGNYLVLKVFPNGTEIAKKKFPKFPNTKTRQFLNPELDSEFDITDRIKGRASTLGNLAQLNVLKQSKLWPPTQCCLKTKTLKFSFRSVHR